MAGEPAARPSLTGSHAGSHRGERPSGIPDGHEQRAGTKPRSRTDLNGSGCRYGNLRIRRLGVRVPPSALMKYQVRHHKRHKRPVPTSTGNGPFVASVSRGPENITDLCHDRRQVLGPGEVGGAVDRDGVAQPRGPQRVRHPGVLQDRVDRGAGGVQPGSCPIRPPCRSGRTRWNTPPGAADGPARRRPRTRCWRRRHQPRPARPSAWPEAPQGRPAAGGTAAASVMTAATSGSCR